MYTDDGIFQKELFDHKIYSSWQFITFTRKNLDVVEYCFVTIKNIIEKMTMKTIRWEQDLFSDFMEDDTVEGKDVKRIAVTTENQPVYELRVAGEKVDPWFLFDKILKDFYQYSMNSFDSISQIANAGLMANKGRKVDTVDFQNMASTFAKQTYQGAFPKTSLWFDTVFNSSEFKYIEAINNRTKHTADIANKLSMGILGSSNKTEIGPFFRKGTQHNGTELADQLQATVDFLHDAWEEFLKAFCDEFVLDKYTENRRHEIGGVYQQKIDDDSGQCFSYAFLPIEDDFDSMPKEIYILLANDRDRITAHVCPFDRILVCKEKHNILGRYIAEDAIGDDCLLDYRKYVKDEEHLGMPCLFYEMEGDTTFYHANPFFNVTTVSNDNGFLNRSVMPF